VGTQCSVEINSFYCYVVMNGIYNTSATHVHGFMTYSEGTTSYSLDRLFLQTFLGKYLRKQRVPIRTLMTSEMHV